MVIANVFDRLIDGMDKMKTPLMIGLDPNIAQFPAPFLRLYSDWSQQFKAAGAAIFEFNRRIIDATYDLVTIYKPQSAYYEQYGHHGIEALEATIEYAKSKGAMVCLDAKRNDIADTSAAYAEAHLGKVLMPSGQYMRALDDVDLMTVNGYLGVEGILPFVEVANRDGKGIFVLAKTSNPGSGELQDVKLETGEEVYARMASMIDGWGVGSVGINGFSNIGAVVGATHPEQAARLRQDYPHIFFLMPGYGAQKAKAETLSNGFDSNGRGAVVNSSRAILYAYALESFRIRHPQLADPLRFGDAARLATIEAKQEINGVLADAGKLPAGW